MQRIASPDKPDNPLVYLREISVLLFIIGGTVAEGYCGWRLIKRHR